MITTATNKNFNIYTYKTMIVFFLSIFSIILRLFAQNCQSMNFKIVIYIESEEHVSYLNKKFALY